jgi:hypothetical protein
MATLETGNINNVPHIHIDLTPEEFSKMILDPYTFLDDLNAKDSGIFLNENVPVTYELLTWGPNQGVNTPPNVCEGGGPMTPNGGGSLCICTPLSIVSGFSHFRVFVPMVLEIN